MPTHFDAVIKDLLVADAIASETTAATFYSGASTKEVQILREDGQAQPSAAGKFFLLAKRNDGTTSRSDIVDGSKVVSVTKTSPVTAVPGHSYFTVDNTGVAVGDQATIFMKYWGLGSMSEMDWKFKNVTYTATSTVALTIAQGIAIALFRNLSEDYYYNNRPQFVHNISGYTEVYATQAAALADKANLDNDDLIWVIADAKPYTVVDDTAVTFAALATEKTDWSTEISGGTARYVDDAAFYNIVITAAAEVYIIDKFLDRKIDLFAGETSKTYVGAAIKTPDSNDDWTEWTVTKVAEAWNPTSGKRLANLEAHLDKKVRQYGSYNYKEFTFVPNIVEATDYYTVTVKYEASDITRMLTANNQESMLVIACASEADADTIIAKIALAQG